MLTIERSTAFKKDFKRESKGKYRKTLDADLRNVLKMLATDMPLGSRFFDHELSGNFSGYRECHLKPDLLLIYSKQNPETLRLARLGSHSELFR